MTSRRFQWRSTHLPGYLGWYLVSHALNAVFYMLSFGSSVFVLFLDDLGLSKDRIGLLLSLFPFCGLIAPFITRWVARFGLKRTYVVFYGARKVVMLLMLAAPWVGARFGASGLFLYVASVLLVFALCRAIAETGYYPWSREFVPNAIRGRLSGQVNLVVSIASGLAMLLASGVLARGQAYGRYQLLIAVASFLGLVSVAAIVAVPRESPALELAPRATWSMVRNVLDDGHFRGFLGAAMFAILGLAGYPFLPLLAREQLLIPDSRVVLFDVAGTLGAMVSSLYWGRTSDRYGGKPVTLLSATVSGVLPWAWLLLPAGAQLTAAGGFVLAFIYGVVTIGYSIGSFRWFMNDVVPMERRTTYTAVWYAGTGLAGGLAPFFAGWVLRRLVGIEWGIGPLRIHAFTVLFAWTSLAMAASLLSYRRVQGGADFTVPAYLRAVLGQDLPAAIAQIFASRRKKGKGTV
jgi:MFS family permease